MSVLLNTRDMEEDYEYEDASWEIKNILNNLDTNNEYLFITGSIGRWNGTNSGWEYVKDADRSFQDVFKDCDDFLFETDSKNLLTITGWHHDGSCTASWWTIDNVKEFEENYYIDYEGNIIKYDENDEEIYDFPFEEIEKYFIPAEFH